MFILSFSTIFLFKAMFQYIVRKNIIETTILVVDYAGLYPQ